MQTPNLRDFYQKALIPIGLNDQNSLKESEKELYGLPSTHWLITLEGVQLPQPEEYFHWKVSIYPSNPDGAFTWRRPIYTSDNIESFDQAIELARVLETYTQKDELNSEYLQEKIS
jgi:hypothetical protein